MNFSVRNATLAEVAETLQGSVLDKPVVDQTGLGGKYDFIVKFTPDPGQMAAFGGLGAPPPTTNPGAPLDLFAAFTQQLGLRLETSKASVEVLVIDKSKSQPRTKEVTDAIAKNIGSPASPVCALSLCRA